MPMFLYYMKVLQKPCIRIFAMSRSLNQCIDRLPTRVGETTWSLILIISIYSPLLLFWTLLEIVGLLAGSCQWGSWSWPSLVHSWVGVLSSSIWDTLVSRISVRAVVAEALAQLLWPEVNKTCTDINSPRLPANFAWRRSSSGCTNPTR